MKRAAFLDRDGVINASIVIEGAPTPPRTPDEVVVLPGVKEAIILLQKNQIVPVVVTNQPDVARGLTTKYEVEAVNQRIREITSIEHFYVCIHDDADDCECRKPKPGLITKAVEDLNIDLSHSFLVGDRWKDVEAGLKAGVECFFIDYSYGERRPEQPFSRVTSLLEAVQLAIGD